MLWGSGRGYKGPKMQIPIKPTKLWLDDTANHVRPKNRLSFTEMEVETILTHPDKPTAVNAVEASAVLAKDYLERIQVTPRFISKVHIATCISG